MKPSVVRIAVAAALAAGGFLALTSSVGAQGIGVDELERMLVPTERKIERGRVVYENQCAGCHGDDGKGEASYPDSKFDHSVPDFTAAKYRHGGGPIQVYNTITKGFDGEYHPTYDKALRYQERWAVTHYVRSLGPTDDLEDPQKVVAQARLEAKKGTCDGEIRETISSKLEPKGQDQLDQGKEIYGQQCASCHGDTGKGDGPAGSALQPAPRNFHAKDNEWTNGTNPLNIFNTLTNGIQGTSMSSYASLSEEKRWALVHYLRQWIPESKRQEATEEDVLSVCRSLSAPEPPESIPVDQAMEALADAQPERRAVRVMRYGEPEVAEDADPSQGAEIYKQECADCHGAGMKGARLGPYAMLRAGGRNIENPRLSFRTSGLLRRHAGGTYREFAQRSASGVHATLPGMSKAALMSESAWKDLHAFVAENGAELDIGSPPDWVAGPERSADEQSGPGGAETSPGAGGADAGTTSPAAPTPAASPDAGTPPDAR